MAESGTGATQRMACGHSSTNAQFIRSPTNGLLARYHAGDKLLSRYRSNEWGSIAKSVLPQDLDLVTGPVIVEYS